MEDEALLKALLLSVIGHSERWLGNGLLLVYILEYPALLFKVNCMIFPAPSLYVILICCRCDWYLSRCLLICRTSLLLNYDGAQHSARCTKPH